MHGTIRFWVSVAQQVGVVNLRGRVGQARTAVRDLTAYAIGADLTPVDGLKAIRRTELRLLSSCRLEPSGSDCSQVSHRGQLEWSPTMRSRIAADVLYQTLSDGNRRWEFTISPRRSVARTARLNLDLGAVVTQLRHHDELRSRVLRSAAVRVLRDDSRTLLEGQRKHRRGTVARPGSAAGRLQSRPSDLGGNATADATFGIFDPWALNVTGGGIFNQRLGSGAFRGYGASVSLIRRF